MGDYSTIRDSIVTAIQGVVPADVPVYSYQRFVADLTSYINLFATTAPPKIIHGWLVTPLPARPIGAPLTGGGAGGVMGGIARDYLFVARGYYGLQDSASTEETFMGIVEAVVQALDAQKNYGDTSVIAYDTECWLETFDIRQFGSPLCHHAEVRVKATVERAVTYA